MSNASVTEFDKLVGGRIRELREARELSQQDLARRIGVTYQQLHKYEHGLNRVAASRLWDISIALLVPVSELFPKPRSLSKAA